MLVELAGGWSVELDRGPDWLLVHLHSPASHDAETLDLADRLWDLLERSFVHRLVLEMDDVRFMGSRLIAELVLLHKRIVTHGGMMRLCGVSDGGYEALRASRLADRFPRFRDRTEAVMGFRPGQPR